MVAEFNKTTNGSFQKQTTISQYFKNQTKCISLFSKSKLVHKISSSFDISRNNTKYQRKNNGNKGKS